MKLKTIEKRKKKEAKSIKILILKNSNQTIKKEIKDQKISFYKEAFLIIFQIKPKKRNKKVISKNNWLVNV